jgi:cell division control protein 45
MLIPLEKIKQLYNKIIENALQSEKDGCTTYIIVSNDTDAICALRMLTTILKSDEVQFVVIPVFSTTHMKQELLKLKKH